MSTIPAASSYSWGSKIADLKTNDDDIISIAKDVATRGSEAEMAAFQFATQKRQRLSEFLSNMIKAVFDTARSLVNNLR